MAAKVVPKPMTKPRISDRENLGMSRLEVSRGTRSWQLHRVIKLNNRSARLAPLNPCMATPSDCLLVERDLRCPFDAVLSHSAQGLTADRVPINASPLPTLTCSVRGSPTSLYRALASMLEDAQMMSPVSDASSLDTPTDVQHE